VQKWNAINTLTLNMAYQNSKLVSKRMTTVHLRVSIFILASVTSMTALNVSPTTTTFFEFGDNAFIIRPVYAQPNLSSMSPNEFQQLAKDYLSTLMELRNQSSTNASLLVDEGNTSSSNETDLAMQQLKTDVNGNYRNPTYGILDFVIPSEWYGSERQWSGDKSISLDMHAGTEAEYMDRLLTPTSVDGNDVIPEMSLESTDKGQLQYTQSLLEEMSPMSETGTAASQCMSLDGSMHYFEPNSTATIDGKPFDVSTMECTYSSDLYTTVVVFKTYRHESSERIYTLQLEVFKDLFTDNQNLQNLQNMIDIKKYSPIIDNAVHTLRVE
jgi:hypothetical protein